MKFLRFSAAVVIRFAIQGMAFSNGQESLHAFTWTIKKNKLFCVGLEFGKRFAVTQEITTFGIEVDRVFPS